MAVHSPCRATLECCSGKQTHPVIQVQSRPFLWLPEAQLCCLDKELTDNSDEDVALPSLQVPPVPWHSSLPCAAPRTLSETASLPLPPAMAPGFTVLLLLGMLGTASRAQPVLTQPHSVFVLPGQTAQLSCTLSPQYNISQFGISWYQQRPGHSLRYLLYYNSERDKHKPAKTPDRFSATKDLASNACILSIASACQDDNGTYYCSLSPAFKWL
ncbi:pre-B lymphocyte protein 3 isoform X2 [Poecile atricapillus]|uniref:pre-B lymphocyte protein 3 isoform X2 n=1 Tax=Poecile atricapillus TaxID=48891 RepID=UPI002739BA87|nr:pre-B lymphocyte protein 3 isoform X2 [Poecile atricapillus]